VLVDGIRVYGGFTAERANELFERYGTRVEDITTYLLQRQDAPMRTLPGYSRREIAYLAETEKVEHLDDLLLRRSMLAMLGRLSGESVREIAQVVGESLGWDQNRTSDEIQRSLTILSDLHNARLPAA
jgi:glycerol-3-phosphate dehydrogenase